MKKILSILLAAALIVCTFAACGNKKTDTSSDLAYVKDKGTLVIGITLFAPMDYYEEGNTTDLKGFEADFARAVCEKLGVTPTFQVISWEAKESELNSKNVDCLWNGLTITDARKNTMSISTPYMANKQVLITKSENADKYSSAGSLKGATVVAEKESAGEEVATSDAFFEGANYTAVDSMAKAIMEVSSGTADAAAGGRKAAQSGPAQSEEGAPCAPRGRPAARI